MRADELEGQHIGEYRLLRQIGEGNLSQVYLAESPSHSKPVAIKVLPKHTVKSDREKFLIQAKILMQVDHPHIVRVYDSGLAGGIPYLVMSYAPHGTLRQLHPKGTRLPLHKVLSYVKQVAEALQYVHDRQMVHRDVKPQNMLLGEKNAVWLSDFGIATISQSLAPEMVDFEGTVAYAAPEQLQGKPQRSSDQYALAVVAYEWISGQWPFTGSFFEVAHSHMVIPAPPLKSKGADVSTAIEDVLARALAKEPEKRFGSIIEFAGALEEACRMEEALRGKKAKSKKGQFKSPLPFEK